MQRASVYFQRLQAHGETFHLEEEGDLVRCRFDFSDDEEPTCNHRRISAWSS